MAINSEVIIWTCVTVAVLVGICAIVLIAMSSRNMKKNREAMRDLQGAIKVGARIMFAGGIYGKIVKDQKRCDRCGDQQKHCDPNFPIQHSKRNHRLKYHSDVIRVCFGGFWFSAAFLA
mgnify:CR=1 FL=1